MDWWARASKKHPISQGWAGTIALPPNASRLGSAHLWNRRRNRCFSVKIVSQRAQHSALGPHMAKTEQKLEKGAPSQASWCPGHSQKPELCPALRDLPPEVSSTLLFWLILRLLFFTESTLQLDRIRCSSGNTLFFSTSCLYAIPGLEVSLPYLLHVKITAALRFH